jgi:hypothetical protein
MELLFLFVVMVAGVIVVGLMAGIIVGRRLDALVTRPDPEPDLDPEPGPEHDPSPERSPEPSPDPELPEDTP